MHLVWVGLSRRWRLFLGEGKDGEWEGRRGSLALFYNLEGNQIFRVCLSFCLVASEIEHMAFQSHRMRVKTNELSDTGPQRAYLQVEVVESEHSRLDGGRGGRHRGGFIDCRLSKHKGRRARLSQDRLGVGNALHRRLFERFQARWRGEGGSDETARVAASVSAALRCANESKTDLGPACFQATW
jgi:hypothetical protein